MVLRQQQQDHLVIAGPGADGRVYVGGDDGRLYALRGSAGLAASTWPMFQRDARHTASGFVERQLPEEYSAGLELEVRLVATPDARVRFYTVEDMPPSGWAVDEVDADGYFDAGNRRVRFGPFPDGLARVLHYRVTPPLTEVGVKQFNGTSSANGAERLVGGHQVLSAVPLHPADNRPVDGWLTLGELTAYGAAWKRGTAWPLAPTRSERLPGPSRLPLAQRRDLSVRHQLRDGSTVVDCAGPPPEGDSPSALPAGTVATNAPRLPPPRLPIDRERRCPSRSP